MMLTRWCPSSCNIMVLRYLYSGCDGGRLRGNFSSQAPDAQRQEDRTKRMWLAMPIKKSRTSWIRNERLEEWPWTRCEVVTKSSWWVLVARFSEVGGVSRQIRLWWNRGCGRVELASFSRLTS
jgi:hypothetical protein